jgi:hypothetical protein
MPKEETLPTRKKMRKGTHSCFECMWILSLIPLDSLPRITLFLHIPLVQVSSVHCYTRFDLCYPLLTSSYCAFFSDALQVADARSAAFSNPTTQTSARSASHAAAGASIKRMPTPKSLSITERTFASGCHDWKLLLTHCSKTNQSSQRVAAKVTV